MKIKKEKRMVIPTKDSVVFRAVENEEEKMIIEGYAITFDSPATHYGMTEIIDRNALAETDMSDVPLRYNHEESFGILARTRNGSLKLEVDDIGLKITADLIDTTDNVDMFKRVVAKLVDKMSFAFTTEKEEWDDATDTRTILKIDKLWDVSLVDIPYYDSTSVFARSLDTTEDYYNKKQKEKRKKLLEEMKKKELLESLK